ncbi:MAG: class I SAM-dependent methyltransferase family protein [Zestosphaera sp.]
MWSGMGRGKLLRKIAEEVLGKEKAEKIWGRIEIIGDIAVIRKPPELPAEAFIPLGEEIIKRLPYVKSVWLAVTSVKTHYRVREHVFLAGENRSTTTYREHGCVFKVDINSVYVSPALNYEHKRIADLVRPGEFIINMFAGAGLFSIIIAKKAKPRKVISIDINPRAYELMRENIVLNRVEDVVEARLGDAAQVVREFVGMADRVLMPLPEYSRTYLPDAILALKECGVIHAYDFVTAEEKDEALLKGVKIFSKELEKHGVYYEFLHKRVVRSVGPRYYQVVLDIRVSQGKRMSQD